MEFPSVLLPIFLIAIGIVSILYAIQKWGIAPVEPEAESTRQMPEIDQDFDVPEEDQEYLAPLMVNILKHLAAHKRSYPTNAMLINHLAESLSEASSHYEKYTEKNKTIQRGNDYWLDVAAVAIRLYDEGTYHNADNTREQFMTTAVLAAREIDQWADRINEEVAKSVKKKMGVEDRGVEDVSQHAQTVAGTPYTADEIEDLKEAHDTNLLRKGKKNKS